MMLPQQNTAIAPLRARLRRREAQTGAPGGSAARLAARVWGFALDGRIVRGADPAGSRLLAARAALLTSERSREELASALRRLAPTASAPRRRMRVAPDAAAVQANAFALSDLAGRLEAPRPVYARGIARLRELLLDGNGPVFRGDEAALSRELSLVARELEGASDRSARRRRRWSRPAGRRLSGRERRSAGDPAQLDPPGFIGSSFMLPDGSWYHGRRDGG